MSRSISLPAVVATLALLVAALPALSAAAPQRAATKTCSVKGKERKLGTTYVTKLSVKGTSCANGEKLVKAFHKCRLGKSETARCARVSGYRCSERRFNVGPLSYDSNVTCKSSTRSVKHTYTQNT